MVLTGTEQREFYVWVNPNDFLVRWNSQLGFTGGPEKPGEDTPQYLLFVPNPNPRPGIISPFHLGTIRNYMAEYELERHRYQSFEQYPSRLYALYLLESRDSAALYKQRNPAHIEGRLLKRGVTVGPYKYSVHDAAWINFLRLSHSLDLEAFEACSRGYWTGTRVENVRLESMGQAWSEPYVPEVLFYGRLEFPDRQLEHDD